MHRVRDRKSTRLNSSHVEISYAVFCLKKKKKIDVYRRLNLANPFDLVPTFLGAHIVPPEHSANRDRYIRLFFFFLCSGDHRDLHSFPTRRSSDLPALPVALVATALLDAGDAALSASSRAVRSEEHTSELQSRRDLVCRLLLEK